MQAGTRTFTAAKLFYLISSGTATDRHSPDASLDRMAFSAKELRKSDGSAALLEHVASLGRGLSTGGRLATGALARMSDEDTRRALDERGLVVVGRVARPECAPLRAAVDAVVADGLPGVLVYLFDETWSLGEGVRDAMTTLLGAEYVLAADAWAWSLPPGGGRGWPAHRGISDVVLDRERPEMLNVWIALSDASLDRACMSFVALGDDPGYPSSLASIDVPAESAIPVPVAASTVLAWNANVLHWGGECRASAAGPRTSCSFTLVRRDAVARIGMTVLDARDLDVARRLDLVAAQIVTYGDGQADVNSDVLSWARAAAAFGQVARKDR